MIYQRTGFETIGISLDLDLVTLININHENFGMYDTFISQVQAMEVFTTPIAIFHIDSLKPLYNNSP